MSLSWQRAKDLGRRLVPPVLTDMIRPRTTHPTGVTFSGDYIDFASASTAAGAEGHESRGVIESTIARTRQVQAAVSLAPQRIYDEWTLQNLAALSMIPQGTQRPSLRVLDFGGGLGLHYLTLRPFLSPSTVVRWAVVETASLVKVGLELFANPELTFVGGIDDLREHFDVVVVSGALQYTDQPLHILATLSRLSDAFLFNRLPLLINAPRDRIVVQSVDLSFQKACYPAWFFSEQIWLGRIAEAGLQIVLRWSAPRDTVVLNNEPIVYQGLLALRIAG